MQAYFLRRLQCGIENPRVSLKENNDESMKENTILFDGSAVSGFAPPKYTEVEGTS